MPKMNWDDLRILDTLARAGSLSAAARLLAISQPQLSRRLRNLEQAVGTRLFDRLPTGLVPTPAGAQLIPFAAEMGSVAAAIGRASPALGTAMRGTLRISVDEVMAGFLTEHLEMLQAAAPNVEFEIAADHAFANLSRREADLLIRRCLPAKGMDVVARRLGDIAHAVYGSKRYLLRHRAALSEERYATCDWIGFAETGLWFAAEKSWLDERLDRPPRLRTNQMTVARDAACAGHGLAVLPCFLAEADSRLLRVTPPIAELTVTAYLLVHRDVLRDPTVRAASNALGALFQRQRSRLLGTASAIADAAD